MYDDKNINLQKLEAYSAPLLAEVLVKKALRRCKRAAGGHDPIEKAVSYNGVTVFGSRDLDGEGTTVGQDYIRALLQLGFKRCERIFELCAGPGYIGYSLLANGFCEKLTLADINPAAVAMARKTAAFNGIENLVNIHHSDCLEQIPADERWDIVVSNPPHFLIENSSQVPVDPRDAAALSKVDPSRQATNLKAFDPDWSIHKRFYASVKKFMRPGGHVVLQENAKGSVAEDFIPMIEAAGGKYLGSHPGTDVRGKSNGMYYMVSRW